MTYEDALTTAQWDTLAALVDRIVPADESPGGWEAGVGDYLRRQFAGDLSERVGLYRAGLDALDAEARAAGGTGFSETPPDAQDALLARVETGGVVAAWPVRPAFFLHQAVMHALEGFYADPGQGGNHEGVSWDMVGFEVRA